MVDVSDKPVTARTATASARLCARPEVVDALLAGDLPKGEALGTARVAGIMAAKRTAEWIPLCHPLTLEWVQVEFARSGPGELTILCTARTASRTGVEMEALVGASAAALTLYDMGKAADKAMTLGPIQLERKSGGRSGEFVRNGNRAGRSAGNAGPGEHSIAIVKGQRNRKRG